LRSKAPSPVRDILRLFGDGVNFRLVQRATDQQRIRPPLRIKPSMPASGERQGAGAK